MASIAHYNTLAKQQRDVEERDESPILRQALLELGIGRGGDFNKIQSSNAYSLVGIDNSLQSLKEARDRYNKDISRNNFRLQLIEADFCIHGISSLLGERKMQLVSSQFALHYAFATGYTARRYFSTIQKSLEYGYRFIATFPNAIKIVKNIQDSPSHRFFGNRYFSVTFDNPFLARYGAKYRFRLDGAVNADEFLVHPDQFIKLAKEHELNTKFMLPFGQFYDKIVKNDKFDIWTKDIHDEAQFLLARMRIFDNFEFKKEEKEICSIYIATALEKEERHHSKQQDHLNMANNLPIPHFLYDHAVNILDAEKREKMYKMKTNQQQMKFENKFVKFGFVNNAEAEVEVEGISLAENQRILRGDDILLKIFSGMGLHDLARMRHIEK
ncbi:MAG: putative mRNA cap guanine N7 methyltransferase [Streblomastix strix]|uniref:mRNA (guanine-N(7))-methyltransferase n=1 Tax=Streblomastix strix TaxID=222440 RepID=A0A5J4UXC8_9EUKA|nr:MAG: putative mRNA cap guanine N7 methyltransferase [Streblomastix strix]